MPLALEAIDAYLNRLCDTIDRLDREQIDDVVTLFRDAADAGQTVFTMGNGGSGSTASHIVCDLNKGASYDAGRDKRFKLVCLNDNVATTLAYGNDVGYESIFVEPLKNFMSAGDLVIGISGSGNSPNVLRAVEWANDHGGVTVGLTGYGGGKLGQIAQHHLNVPIDDMQIAEDLHLVFGHILLRVFCDEASASPSAKPQAAL